MVPLCHSSECGCFLCYILLCFGVFPCYFLFGCREGHELGDVSSNLYLKMLASMQLDVARLLVLSLQIFEAPRTFTVSSSITTHASMKHSTQLVWLYAGCLGKL